MIIIKIFLASSSELKNDREQFEIFINRKNKEYIKEGIFLELVLWEDFFDAMSPTRSQDEYNNAISNCDVFVSLFNTKVGKYTKEEFLKALETFRFINKPLIYTYFKDSQISMSQITNEISSLLDFKKKLGELGHFYKSYKEISDLKYLFDQQLNKFIPRLTENIKADSQAEKQESVQFLQSQIMQLVEEFKQERSHNQQLAESLQCRVEKQDSVITELQETIISQQNDIQMLNQKLENQERSRKPPLEDLEQPHHKLEEQVRATIDRISLLEQFEGEYQKSYSTLQESIEEQKQLTSQLQQLASDNRASSHFILSLNEELKWHLSEIKSNSEQQIHALRTKLEEIEYHINNLFKKKQVKIKDTNTDQEQYDLPTEILPSFEEHKLIIELVREYNQNRESNSLAAKIIEVSETQKSISDRSVGVSQGIILEEKSRGIYGIITKDNYHYLVPSKSFRITDNNYKTVQAFFECRNYQKGYSERFELLKPATVIPLADNQQWQLREPGILECN